jgi:AbrB family looped-hinge helix DNA binding protein
MHVTQKGQVILPKRIRDAAGVLPGSEVTFALDAGRIVITQVSSGMKGDHRARLWAAAAKVHESLDPKFRRMGPMRSWPFCAPLTMSSRAELRGYDGSSGFVVDSNGWIDCIDRHSDRHGWAVDRLQACSERAPLHVNLVIYTELLVPGPDVAALDALLDVYDTLRSPLHWSCAALAARAFAIYRRRGGVRRSPLPDFYIGAHAAVANLTVLTRNESPYRSCFPRFRRVCPA